MTIETVLKVLERVEEYLTDTHHQSFSLILHGGEPTLWPQKNFETFFSRLKSLRDKFDITTSLQTNGYTRIDKSLLELFSTHKVTRGISLDGPEEYNDLRRLNHAGKGSYRRILENIQRIIDSGYGHLISGFLSVACPEIPPKEFLNWIEELPVKRMSVLWPIEFNHDNPPWQQTGQSYEEYVQSPKYGKWFSELFLEWLRRDNEDLYIRHFYEVIHRMLGSKNHTDSIGNDEIDMFVVNTDGVFEYSDYVRSFKDGGSRTKFNVFENSIADLSQDSIFEQFLSLRSHLPTDCINCSHQNVCGGGFLPGRMKDDYINLSRKSILCTDQFYFFSTVSKIVAAYYPKSAFQSNIQ